MLLKGKSPLKTRRKNQRGQTPLISPGGGNQGGLTPLIFLALAALACGGDSPAPAAPGPGTPTTTERPTLPPTYRPTGHMAAGDVFVHLFEWKWTDSAPECETVLGPAGFRAVQISPPQEHSVVPRHDWSERYQPVSYSIARSRSGTAAEFTDMVSRCKAAGVGIYALAARRSADGRAAGSNAGHG